MHRRAISRRLAGAATGIVALAAAACSDLIVPDAVVAGADLLPLPLKSGAPNLSSLTFTVRNGVTTERRILFNDGFNTTYVFIRFPAGSMASLNGQPVASDDAVSVTVDPLGGGFGFALSPTALEFAAGNEPSATIGIEPWGDFSVGPANAGFATPTEYKNALDVWEEVGVDRWRVAPGSGSVGTSDVGATIDAPGTYMVAARR